MPNEAPAGLHIREYGTSGPPVIVLHGGPGAAGSAAPLARGLADRFRVFEPWQRGSGETPLSVAGHIADLHDVVIGRVPEEKPALVGESWGAMLALAYAAAHPSSAGPVVLVGCGTFDPESRARYRATLDERMDEQLRRNLARLETEYPDPRERLEKQYELIRPLYAYDPVGDLSDDGPPVDIHAHVETWEDMVRLQGEGFYPAAFIAIRTPVLMLHGAYDPHPGEMIRAGLAPYITDLEYHELPHCGHSPWEERHARDEFFSIMKEWLIQWT